ncbi:MAG TPA: hypothetical protein VFD92_04605 [Candidatus Binatia bacterium]|nr:hypothetical protein [Candidatus Binatia bacterium]
MRLFLALMLLTLSTAAHAAATCSARIDHKTGVVKVSASGVSGTSVTWGEAPGGPYPNSFYVSAGQVSCFAPAADGKGVMGSCQIDQLDADARIPTVDCMIYVKDAGAECAAHIKFCSPQLDGLGGADGAKLDYVLAHTETGPDPITGVPTVKLKGANLQIVNNVGETESSDGTGNLILGGNGWDKQGTPVRNGSHSLIIGENAQWSGWTNLNVGDNNRTFGDTSVGIGLDHVVTGFYNTQVGGIGNTVGGAPIDGGGPIGVTGVGGSGNTCMSYVGGCILSRNSTTTGIQAGVYNSDSTTVAAEGAATFNTKNVTVAASATGATVKGKVGGAPITQAFLNQ